MSFMLCAQWFLCENKTRERKLLLVRHVHKKTPTEQKNKSAFQDILCVVFRYMGIHFSEIFHESWVVALQCLSLHALPILLSDAWANPLWGRQNNEHWGGGTVLWSCHNVGLQLKLWHRCCLVHRMNECWQKGQSEQIPVLRAAEECHDGCFSHTSTFGKDGLGTRFPNTTDFSFVPLANQHYWQ